MIVAGSYRQFPAVVSQTRPTITVDEKRSLLELPVVGGHAQATAIPSADVSPRAQPAVLARRDDRRGVAGAKPKGLEVPR